MFLIFRPELSGFPETLTLSRDEYRHVRARRLRAGGDVFVGDGRGQRQRYRLRETETDAPVELTITDEPPQNAGDREPPVELLTAMPDGRRWDWLLQKATELGATRIQPLHCEHSEARRIKRERDERIIAEAAAQSRRFVLPALGEIAVLKELLANTSDAAGQLVVPDRSEASEVARHRRAIVLDPRGDRSLARPAPSVDSTNPQLQLVVGPEGGFSERELDEFRRIGCAICTLATPILRVETAALAALSWAALYSG